MQNLDQVSIWEVVEPTKMVKKVQEKITNIRYTWYRGGFFKVDSVSCNMFSIEAKDEIKKVSIIIDRYGVMDQIVYETNIENKDEFWKNINSIIYSDIDIDYYRNTSEENRFCIRANGEKILAGKENSKKLDENFVKFLEIMDIKFAKEKIKELLNKYERLEY